MTILALDIATTTGWALLDPRTPDRPFLGSIRFPSDPDEIGRAGDALWQFLTERHAMHTITEMIQEAQHIAAPRQKFRAKSGEVFDAPAPLNMKVIRRLVGLAAIAELFAFQNSIPCWEVSIGTWRKHAFGNGRMKREEAKERAMAECRALGFDPSNDNEAEAFFILDYQVALRNKHGAGIVQPWRDKAFFDRSGAAR